MYFVENIIKDINLVYCEFKTEEKRIMSKKDLELHEAARKEEQKYLQKKENFYNNPLHWSNNRRRRHGFPVL